MKTAIALFIVVTISLGFMADKKIRLERQVETLQSKVGQLQEEVSSLKYNARSAVRLLERKEWYLVRPGLVSSEPKGQGWLVDFEPGDWHTYYNSLDDAGKFCGKKMTFSRNNYALTSYTVAGGLLRFDYCD